MTNLRLFAARIINDVTEGRSLSDALTTSLPSLKESRDRAFVQALCYGVCRFYSRLDVILSHLLKKPMKAKDSDLHALLLVGLYQLMAMRIPEYAAVTETVNATEQLNKPWARGLTNAVLREYLRRRQAIDDEIKSDAEAEFAHPEWWLEALETDWPTEWQAILTANNAHPPFSLRVNQSRLTREDYKLALQAKGLSATDIVETSHGIMLSEPVSVEELPGFSAGDVSVQDGAAQLAAELLLLEKGQRVLDACAAPGGKLTHIREIQPDLAAVFAIEKDATRIPSIKDNLARLKQQATIICDDAADVQSWWDGKLFDRILLDAPCSASGVIRRHPDIKLLREREDIEAFAEEQLHLLVSLWPLLAPGGFLVYATCSVFPQENSEVIKDFLSTQADAQEDKLVVEWGLPCAVGRQILPGMHAMDGFYFARLKKEK